MNPVSVDWKRKLLITFTPGKSILTNAFIPCAHADPYYGTLAPGQAGALVQTG